MLALMGFMFFFLLSFIAMFFFFIRKQENFFRQLSDEHAQLRVLLRALECRLDHMSADNKAEEGQASPECDSDAPGSAAGHDPLLHLSFEEPQTIDAEIDPALDINMDEPAGQQRAR